MNRTKCTNCDWTGTNDDILSGKNPFDPTEEVFGCPKCKSVDPFIKLCDVAECRHAASGGHPTLNGYATTSGNPEADGYTFTCFEHTPKEK
jgi:hypothetical protein